jgi:two-component system sensor histidine kinase/response regulator
MGPTLAAFGLAAVLTVAISALLFSAERHQADAADDVRRSERMVFLSSRLQRLTIDLETGIRGRLLARQERFLEPYNAALADIPGILDRLDQLGQRVRSLPHA